MNIDICILRFDKVHAGSGQWLEQIDSIIHSDTLFNAICWCYRLLYGNEMLEEFLDMFNYSRPLYISSAFPFIDNTTFFPRPMNTNLQTLSNIDKKDSKSIKGIRFVSKDIFEKLIRLEMVEGEIHGQFLANKKVDGINEYVEYRNMLDRRNKYSTIYRTMYIRSDYWFAYKVSNEYRDAIRASIRLLADEGIGGERSTGSGLFKVEFTNMDIESIDESKHIVTLSLLNPNRDEAMEIVNDEYARYMVIRRGGGYIDKSNSRRGSLYMIAEGSFLPRVDGRLVDIGIDRKAYEYGICLGLGAIYEE